MKSTFTTLVVLSSLLFAAFARADGGAQTSIGRFNSLMVSNLTQFKLAPSLETFATEHGQVSVDLSRQLLKLSLDSQRGRFEVELPIVSREKDVCGVVIYRAQKDSRSVGADGFLSLEIRDHSRSTCASNNGAIRAPIIRAYLVSETLADDGVSVEKAVSTFAGAPFAVTK